MNLDKKIPLQEKIIEWGKKNGYHYQGDALYKDKCRIKFLKKSIRLEMFLDDCWYTIQGVSYEKVSFANNKLKGFSYE